MATVTQLRDVRQHLSGVCHQVEALAADATLTIGSDTGVVLLTSSDANAKAATVNAGTKGQVVHVSVVSYASTGSYTIDAKQGTAAQTITLDAAGEGAILVCDGSDWQIVALLGGATAA